MAKTKFQSALKGAARSSSASEVLMAFAQSYVCASEIDERIFCDAWAFYESVFVQPGRQPGDDQPADGFDASEQLVD